MTTKGYEMKKILITTIIALITFNANAQSKSASSNFTVSATVLPYCKLEQRNTSKTSLVVQECFGKTQVPVKIEKKENNRVDITY